MGELIFFAVIILFTILEAVAKRRKQREGGEEGGDEDESWTPAPVERQPRPKAERRPRVERGSSSSTDRGMPKRGAGREERSETMIPADLWEEIAGLATGETPRRRPEPRDMDTEEARSLEQLDVERSADAHLVHRSHRGYGTDPSERAPSEQDWRPTQRGNRNAKRVRAMLRGSEGTDALKQAVILREVLGPPVSMEDEGG